MKYLWLGLLILLSAAACTPADNCSNVQNGEPTLHMLFIGNSFTFYNDLPGMFTQLACSGGHKVQTGMAAEGGWTLAEHASSPQTNDKLIQQKWDLVILQEQSLIPAIEPSRTLSMVPALRTLVGKVQAAGAQPVLFMTWGYRDGKPEQGLQNYSEMQAQLYYGYMSIAEELHIPVVQVGSAWARVRSLPNPMDLWQSDGSHPNEQGTYLAACAFYAAVFHQSPQDLSYQAKLSRQTAQILQSAAADAILEER